MGEVQSCLACDENRSAGDMKSKEQGMRKPLSAVNQNVTRSNNNLSSKHSVASSRVCRPSCTAPIMSHRETAQSNPYTDLQQSTGSNGEGLNKVGIGAYFERSKDDENVLRVKSVLRGSPASACGQINVGDHIVAVDGESVYGSSLAGVRARTSDALATSHFLVPIWPIKEGDRQCCSGHIALLLITRN